MADTYQIFEEAVAALRNAEQEYSSAESRLIQARRTKRDAERAYYAERFPTKEALTEYFGY